MIDGKYNRIVAYGCSFTAGDELADAIVLGMPEEEVDAIKRSGAMDRSQLYGDLRLEIERHGKTLTWVRWVADHFGVSYSNRAKGGGSIQQMVYRLERDYYNGLISEDDLVIVGVTSMFRWFQFDYTGYEMSWVFSFQSGIPSLNEQLAKHYINDYNILWNYHLHLNYLQKLADERKNIKILHALKPFSREAAFMDTEELLPNFKTLISSFEYPAVLIPYGISDLYGHIPKEEATHGWGHPKIKFHKEYANLIIDKLESMSD